MRADAEFMFLSSLLEFTTKNIIQSPEGKGEDKNGY
jgi:hypothetical protein